MDDKKQFFRDALERRSKRLVNLVEISAPDHLVGQEIALVFQAAIGYCPDEVFNCMSDWLAASAYRDAGFCDKTRKECFPG